MRKAIITLMLGATLQAMAQQTTVTTPQMVFVQKPTDPLEAPAFLSEKELPDHSKYIPAPPEVGTEAFQNDAYYYKWGKEQRLTPRAAQAALDETQWTSKAFSAAAGFTISPKDCPEIFKLVDGSQKDAKKANSKAKNHYKRTRPFVQFEEPSLIPEADKSYADSYSYPSGHSVRGWVYALTLALVVPDSTEALIHRATEYAMNRLICGRHYKSDIDASLVEATAVMSRLLSNEAFQAQLARARKEYALIKEQQEQEEIAN